MLNRLHTNDKYLISFDESVKIKNLPQNFNFPFYYEPHPLCKTAALELQKYLIEQQEWVHNFGLIDDQDGLEIGKMFGVLLVETKEKEIGYLAAFSGKMAEKNHLPGFVPPVFDMLTIDSFFNLESSILTSFTNQIKTIEDNEIFHNYKIDLAQLKKEQTEELSFQKKKMKIYKLERRRRKGIAKLNMNSNQYGIYGAELINESLFDKFYFKELGVYLEGKVDRLQAKVDVFQDELDDLKARRKAKSNDMQNRLFDEYHFYNIDQEKKSLLDIFVKEHGIIPPAGSGECAAPKLLQYAFSHGYKPLSMAEFWWGKSPNSEIRKHRNFYPACNSKCKPILGHMLKGMSVDENPMASSLALDKEIEIIFEDDYLVVINKPIELLSVPGKVVEDSVYTRMKTLLPKATGPIIVHRLDMSTSGIMLIAKSQEVYKHLQQQFIKRTIKKRYTALLDGIVAGTEGTIELPLRVDLDDRPRQLVCYEHGKQAKTFWKLIHINNGQSLVHFYPITGRTHQLRVHAAHPKGLNIPIVGDDLYGVRKDRLHLHAEFIKFVHPITEKNVKITQKPSFGQ